MNDPEMQARGREARRRLQTQRRRAGELRARAVLISLIAFVLLWGIVFVQMATGNDPVLGNSPKATASGRGRARSGGNDGISDGGEAAGARAAAAEAVETTEPNEVEPEYVESEPEPEYVESEPEPEYVEPEPEPAPVITAQS
jgi:hypothetical protein